MTGNGSEGTDLRRAIRDDPLSSERVLRREKGATLVVIVALWAVRLTGRADEWFRVQPSIGRVGGRLY